METTACTLVGNYLGKGDAQNAIAYFKSACLISFLISALLTFYMHVKFLSIVGLITDLQLLIDKSMEVKHMVLICILPDIMTTMLRGTIKSMGL